MQLRPPDQLCSHSHFLLDINMPTTRPLTPEEEDYLRQQGVDPEGATANIEDKARPTIDTLSTIGRTERQAIGGQIGGAGMAALGPFNKLGIGLGALVPGLGETGISEGVGGLIGSGIDYAVGGYLGGTGQEALQGKELTEKVNREAQEGEEANPNTALATSVIGAGLVGGGKPNLSNIGKAISGDKQALAKIAIGAVANPAINTGIDLATTGQLPTARSLVGQVVGGGLFSEPSALGRMMHGGAHPEPSQEPGEMTTSDEDEMAKTPTSPYTGIDEGGNSIIDDKGIRDTYQSTFNTKPNIEGLSTEDALTAMSKYRRQLKTSGDDMRQALHDKFLKDTAITQTGQPGESAPEPNNSITQIDGIVSDKASNAVLDSKVPDAEKLGNQADDNDQRILQESGKTDKPPISPEEQQAVLKETGMNIDAPPQDNELSDRQKYEALQQQFKDHVQGGRAGTPEFNKTWQDMESLKNKYGGMPPPIEESGQVNAPLPNKLKQNYIDAVRKWKNETDPVKKNNEFFTAKNNARNAWVESPEGIKELDEKLVKHKLISGGDPRGIGPINIDSPARSVPIIQSNTSLEQHIRSGKATTGTTLQHIVGMNNEFSPLAKEMLAHASPEKLQDRVAPSGNKDDAYYNLDANITRLGDNRINDPATVIHELGHSLISNNLPQEFEGLTGKKLKIAMDNYLQNGTNPHVKELIQTYYEAAKGMGLHNALFGTESGNFGIDGLAGSPKATKESLGSYAMGSLHEFTSMALSDSTFQKKLNRIESSKGGNLWSRFVDAVRGILGVDVKKGSVLERALKVNENLVKQPREGTMPETRSGEEQRVNAPAPHGTSPSDETKHMGWLGNATRSMIDKIRDIPHPAAKGLADSFHKALNTAQELNGRTTNKVLEAGKNLTPNDKAAFQRIAQWENENGRRAPTAIFPNSRVRNFYNVERAVYDASGKHQIAINEPVMRGGQPTKLVQKPFAHPTTLRPEVDEILKKNTDQPAIQQMGKDFIDNQIKYGKSPQDAARAWDEFKTTVQGNTYSGGSNMQHYNAVRREQGVPLPASMSRTDPVENLQYYYNRRATDNAFYEHIESNPKSMAALGQTKDAWKQTIPASKDGSLANNPTVQAQLKEFQGDKGTPGAHNENALSTAATTLFIAQPGLEIHKVGSNLVNTLALADNPVQMGRMLVHMISNFRSGLQTATENGVLKLTARSATQFMDNTAKASDRLQSVAQAFRNISTLGGRTEKFSTGLMQAGLEEVIPNKLAKANAGDESAQTLMRRIDPDYKVGDTYTPKEIGQLASRMAGYIHGTGDGRTMPAWMSADTEFSGFFKLAHWSVSQTNRFMTDVYTPATKGNYTPLINSIFGGVIGGYIIKELREKLQGKQGQIPSLQDIASSEGGVKGNIPLVAYNAIAAAQYAGFAGLLSQVAKYPFDIAYKNSPQGATFPLDNAVSDIATTAGQVGQAIANDPAINWLELTSHVMGHLLSNNIGLAKVALNQGIDNGLVTGTVSDKKALNDKLGELRRFDMVSGLPYDQSESAANPYMNLEQKKFKTEQDPEKIVQQLPVLVNNIVSKYGDKPDVLMAKLKGLKENEYDIMPSPDSYPLSFVKYISFLKKEKGDDAANAILVDYMRHKIINEAKAEAVP